MNEVIAKAKPRARDRDTDLNVLLSEGPLHTEQLTIQYPLGIYIVDERKYLNLVATGFFVDYQNRLFLVTAYHAVKALLRNNIDFWVGCNFRVTKIFYTAHLISTDSDEPKREEDTDIVAYLVSPHEPRFQEFKKNAVKHHQSIDCMDANAGFAYVYFTGLPLSKNKTKRTDVDQNGVTSHKLVTFEYKMGDLERMKKVGRSPKLFQSMSWTKKKRNGENSEYPQGCSGSPVWMVRKRKDDMGIYLCGVYIEFFQRHKLFIFTRIEVIYDLLDELPENAQ